MYSLHVFVSEIVGTLLFGGLHFTTFVMYIDSLNIPALSNARLSLCPAIPTNGSPFLSSFLPCASPMKITSDCKFPLPGTAFVLVLESSHLVHSVTFCLIISNSESIFSFTLYCVFSLLTVRKSFACFNDLILQAW